MYINGIKQHANGCNVRVKVNGKLFCKSFSIQKFGTVEECFRQAQRFIITRKSIQRKNKIGIRNIREKICTIEGRTYLYLELKLKTKLWSKCVGRLYRNNESELKSMQASDKYQNILLSLKQIKLQETHK